MVSSRSAKPMIWALYFGYFIGAIPATFDPINFRIIPKYGQSYRIPFCHLRTPRTGFIWAGIYILIIAIHILYLIIFLLCLEHSKIDFYMASFLLGCFLFPLFVQILAFLYFENYIDMLNALIILDLKIRK